MTEEKKIPTREEKLAPVVAKAWLDEAYRKELVADPKAVLSKEFGIELPDSLSIEVVEENEGKLYIVIPAKPKEDQLTDEQLKAVAGGGKMTASGEKLTAFLLSIGVITDMSPDVSVKIGPGW